MICNRPMPNAPFHFVKTRVDQFPPCQDLATLLLCPSRWFGGEKKAVQTFNEQGARRKEKTIPFEARPLSFSLSCLFVPLARYGPASTACPRETLTSRHLEYWDDDWESARKERNEKSREKKKRKEREQGGRSNGKKGKGKRNKKSVFSFALSFTEKKKRGLGPRSPSFSSLSLPAIQRATFMHPLLPL